jgi:hypothetical protein
MMIARGFRSVIWVGAVGAAALGCYMVSLRVATERSELAGVQRRIVDAKRDIRSLQTELGTRGRLNQLEDWNSSVLALSAPSSAQFVKDAYALAQLQTRQSSISEQSGNVRMAAVETSDAGGAASAAPVAKPGTPPRMLRAIAPTPASPHAVAAAPVRRASFEEDGSAGRIGAGTDEKPHKLLPTRFDDDGSADRIAAADAKRPHNVRHATVLAAAMGAPASRQGRNGGGGAR